MEKVKKMNGSRDIFREKQIQTRKSINKAIDRTFRKQNWIEFDIELLPGEDLYLPRHNVNFEEWCKTLWSDYTHDPTAPFTEYWDSLHDRRTKREEPIMITWTFKF